MPRMHHFQFVKSPLFICFLCGSVATLGLAPAFFWPAAFLISPCLYLMAHASSAYQAGLRAFMTSWGWSASSLYWIGHSLFVEGGGQLLLLPVVLLGLPAFLALFWLLSGLIFFQFSSVRTIRIIWISFGLAAADIARSTLFTGFPWNVSAHIAGATSLSSQSVYFIGQHSLNFVVMAMIAAGALVFLRQYKLAILLAFPGIIALGCAADRLVMRAPPSLAAFAPEIDRFADIRIIQPAIPQNQKWKRSEQPKHLARIAELAHSSLPIPPLIILPESALTSLWPVEQQQIEEFSRQITAFDGQLLSGILRAENAEGGEKRKLFNSAILYDRQNASHRFYDKKHLVPFGEYVPFRTIPFIDAIAGPVDFSPGQPLQGNIQLANGLQLAILICYEIIFPEFLQQNPAHKDADIIVNLTNDGWFGNTAGPHQHLLQTRLRAIEQAKPVIRVANTGISAGFDAYGVELSRLDLDAAGILDFQLLQPAINASLWRGIDIAAYRWMMVWLAGGFLVGLCLALEIMQQKRHNRTRH